MRSCTVPGEFVSNDENSVPQIGMSRDPCAEVSGSPWITLATFNSGNLPPFLDDSVVKLAGVFLRAAAAGPSPLPSLPWQTAQYSWNISAPFTGEVAVTGAFLMV